MIPVTDSKHTRVLVRAGTCVQVETGDLFSIRGNLWQITTVLDTGALILRAVGTKNRPPVRLEVGELECEWRFIN